MFLFEFFLSIVRPSGCHQNSTHFPDLGGQPLFVPCSQPLSFPIIWHALESWGEEMSASNYPSLDLTVTSNCHQVGDSSSKGLLYCFFLKAQCDVIEGFCPFTKSLSLGFGGKRSCTLLNVSHPSAKLPEDWRSKWRHPLPSRLGDLRGCTLFSG